MKAWEKRQHPLALRAREPSPPSIECDPRRRQLRGDAVVPPRGGGSAHPSQLSPRVGGRHSPGESLGGGGPRRQLPAGCQQEAGDPPGKPPAHPPPPPPSEDGRPRHGHPALPSRRLIPSTLPWVQAGPQPARPRRVAQSPPPPTPPTQRSLKAQSTQPSPTPCPSPSPVENPDSALPLPAGWMPGSNHPRAHHFCALRATAQPQARCSGRGDAVTDSRPGSGRRLPAGPPPHRVGEASPPAKGQSANSPLHHRGSGIPAPPGQEPTLAPPQAALTLRWGNPGGTI